MKKVVFFDIDGTLVTTEGKLLQSTIKAVNFLHENGVLVCLASGRATIGALWIIDELRIKAPCMFHSGAEIYDPINKTSLWSAPLTKAESYNLIKICRSNELYLELYSGDSYYIERKNILTDIHSEVLRKSPVVCNFDDLNLEFIKGVIVADSALTLEKVKRLELPKLKLGIAPGSKFKDIYFCNVTNEAASRENAFKWFSNHFDLINNDSIIFGDAVSDIPFMKLCSFSVAMGNSDDIVKEYASFITYSNDEDGINHAISVLFPKSEVFSSR